MLHNNMSTYYLSGNNVSAWFVPRVECTTMDLANVSMEANVTGITWAETHITSNGVYAPAFIGNGAMVTTTHMSLSNIQITDASFVSSGASALASNTAGYVVVNGSGFAGTMSAVIGGTVPPSSLTKVSPTQIQMTLGPLTTGTYPVWLFSDQYPDVRMTTLQVSPMPVWTTAATLANVTKYAQFTQTLVATESFGSTLTYTVANGSSLPPNVTLASNGVLSGNILTDPGNTTTYSFSVNAVDAEFQTVPRLFGLTAVFRYPVGIVFTSSTTYVVPTAATVNMFLIGGGGGGRGGNGSGGGAGYITTSTLVLTGAQELIITIGDGGVGGTSSISGSNGGVTSVSGSGFSAVVANGGVGGGGVANGSSGGGGAEPSASGYVSGVGGSGGSNGTRSGSNYADSGLGTGMGTAAFAAAMSFNMYYTTAYNFRAGAAGTQRPATGGISWGGTGGGGVICDSLAYPTAGNGGVGTGAQGFGAGASSTRESNVTNAGAQGTGAPGLVYIMIT